MPALKYWDAGAGVWRILGGLSGTPRAWGARASAAVQTNATTTVLQCTGASVTISVSGPADTFLVYGAFDVTNTGATNINGIGELYVDGSVGTGLASAQAVLNGSTLALRVLLNQWWVVSGLTAGTHTLDLRYHSTTASGNHTVNGTHTGILVCQVIGGASIPLGKVAGVVFSTAADSTAMATTAADITGGMSVTWTADPARLYKVTLIANTDQITTAGQHGFYITDAANTVKYQYFQGANITAGTGGSLSWALSYTESGLSGSITRKVRCVATQATGRLRCGIPFQLWVEDIGVA